MEGADIYSEDNDDSKVGHIYTFDSNINSFNIFNEDVFNDESKNLIQKYKKGKKNIKKKIIKDDD